MAPPHIHLVLLHDVRPTSVKLCHHTVNPCPGTSRAGLLLSNSFRLTRTICRPVYSRWRVSSFTATLVLVAAHLGRLLRCGGHVVTKTISSTRTPE